MDMVQIESPKEGVVTLMGLINNKLSTIQIESTPSSSIKTIKIFTKDKGYYNEIVTKLEAMNMQKRQNTIENEVFVLYENDEFSMMLSNQDPDFLIYIIN